MVKIFIGNLSQDTTVEDLRSLFSQYGKISECDVLKRYGFVHMDNKADAEEAIRNLHQHELNGMPMNVELSRGRSKASTKLHVSNISSECTNQELRAKFEEYGPVVECDIVKDYAFVHMERVEDAMEAISGLDNTAFQGKLLSVQLSTSRLRTAPGMGDQTGCYVCGKQGHWSKDCHLGQNDGYSVGPRGGGYGFRGGRGFPRGGPGFAWGGAGFLGGLGIPRGSAPDYRSPSYETGAGYMGGLSSPLIARRPSYGATRDYSAEMGEQYSYRGGDPFPERSPPYKRERYSGVDFYEKYRAHPYGSSYSDERSLSLPSSAFSSSSTISRERLPPSILDSYERRPLPFTGPSTSSYISRDRSPIRRVPFSGDSISYERSYLSSVPSVSRSSAYDVARARDTYADRVRYAY